MEKEQDDFFLKKFDKNYQNMKKLTANVQEIIKKNAEYETLSNISNIFLISLTVALFFALLSGVKNILYIFLILFWIAVAFKIFLLLKRRLAKNKINKMEELYEKSFCKIVLLCFLIH
jgi:Flp pilus assembly protein TadB